MFSKLFSFFSSKRKFSSTEETNTEGSNRPTKRVRSEPSSTNEDLFTNNTPVQAACTNDDEEREEREVLEAILLQGTMVETGGETPGIGAGLQEEEGRHRIPALAQPPQEGSMGVVEGRFTAPLPHRLRGAHSALPFDPRPTSPFRFGIPPVPSSSPWGLGEWVSESQASPPPSILSIFILPPPAQPGHSSSNHQPAPSLRSPPTVIDESSNETILASLRQLREQSTRSPCSSEADDDELAEDIDESGDEDLSLTTAMMQAGNPPSPNPEHHREYPVYVEDLDLPEDQPQVPQPETPVIIIEPWVRPVVEDEETPEERLARLVREGEAEDGVDLE